MEGAIATVDNQYPTVVLKEVAQPISRPVDVFPGNSYRTMGVKWWGEGAYERETIDGSQTAAKTLSIIRTNDLVINKIWVRHGSTAIAGKNVDGCAVSGEFPTCELDTTKVLPEWIHWQTKTKQFWDKCASLSQGTSGKNRIKPELFLTIKIPLPPIEEQRRVVVRIEELVAKVEEARGLRSIAIEEIDFLVGSAQQRFFKPEMGEIRLGDVATIIDPNPSHRYPNYVEQGIPMISTVNFVGDTGITTANAKQVSVEFYEETLGKFNVGSEDIIFSRKGKIGYSRPHPPNITLAMTHTLCVIQPAKDRILPRYLLHFTKSLAFINYLMDTMNPNAGVPTLGLEVIRSSPLRLPSLEEQKYVVAYLDNLQLKVDRLKQLQAETAQELNAMLPSILDKAFRGSL